MLSEDPKPGTSLPSLKGRTVEDGPTLRDGARTVKRKVCICQRRRTRDPTSPIQADPPRGGCPPVRSLRGPAAVLGAVTEPHAVRRLLAGLGARQKVTARAREK
jgi:hypothetical protein